MENNTLLIDDFKRWLQVLGYSKKSVYSYCSHIKELLDFANGQLHQQTIQDFINALPNRPNQRRAGALNPNTIAIKIRVLKLFLNFLALIHRIYFQVNFPKIDSQQSNKLPLTLKQIQNIYQVIDQGKQPLKDRAIMAIYYACGLRRSEGINLHIKHLLFNQKLLFVHKGKWGKSRYIPISKLILKDFKNYIQYDRPNSKYPNLLLNTKAKPISPTGIIYRINKWKIAADIKQPLTLHIFRHSIASHLLHNGMSLKFVSAFLGHASLTATQRYTHLILDE